MPRLLFAAIALMALAQCGPVPVDQAERMCIADAQMAQHPRGTFGIGLDPNGNTSTSLSVGISSDFLLGHDPDQVFSNCVYQRSGQAPTHPFSSLPEAHM